MTPESIQVRPGGANQDGSREHPNAKNKARLQPARPNNLPSHTPATKHHFPRISDMVGIRRERWSQRASPTRPAKHSAR